MYWIGLPSSLKTAEGIVENASKDKMNKKMTKKLTWSGVSKAFANSCLKT